MPAAIADTVNVSGDSVTTTGNNTTLALGDICKNASASHDVHVAVSRNGNVNGNVFANSASVTFSIEPPSSGYSATLTPTPATVTLPSNWATVGNNTLSGFVTSTVTFAGSATLGAHPGTVTYDATGAKSGGGSLTVSGTLKITANVIECDTTPPDTSITSMPPAFSSSTSAAFAFTGTDDVTASGSLTFKCKLDAGSFASCTSPKSYSGLATGSHSFAVEAIDAAGNVDPTPAAWSWTVDTAAPDTTIITKPSSPTSSTSATFTFSGTDDVTLGNDLTFQCSLDSLAYAACTSPKSYTSLTAAAHTFDVRAIDQAGNVDPTPAHAAWTIDTAPPAASITASPDNVTKHTDASFSFSGTDDVTAPGDLSFWCKLDAGAWESCSSPQSYTGPLAEGVHTFSVKATDQAGNTGDAASFSWTIDLTAPDTSIDSAPSGYVNSGSATVTFSGLDAVTAPGDLTFECKADAGLWSTCTTPLSLSGLTDGPHTVSVRATDEAGNTDATPAEATWTVDTTPPDTTIDTMPSDPSGSATANFTFSGSDNISAAGDLTFECSLDGADFADCSTGSASLTLLSEGVHTFDVRATDQAGNTDPTPASFTWTVDLTPPTVTVTAPAAPSGQGGYFNASDGAQTVDVSATDASGVSALSCLDGLDSITLDSETGSAPRTASFTLTADGVHSITCTATDSVGNEGAAAGSQNSATVSIDTVAPAPSCDSVPTAWQGANVTINCTASDGGSGLANSSDATFSLQTTVSAGTEDAAASTGSREVADAAGNSVTVGPFSAKVDLKAPAVATDTTADSCSLPGSNGWCRGTQTAGFNATDGGSGLASDAAASRAFTKTSTVNGTAVQIPSGAVADMVGNSNAGVNAGPYKIDSVAPGSIAFTGIAGQTYPVADLPAQSAIGCTASDSTSGLSGCVVTGYSSSFGSHTLTATATDNAGNSATGTLTYIVGLQSGWILPPVAPNTSAAATNLSAFKIKSTIPIKFHVYLDGAQSQLMTTPPAGSVARLTFVKVDSTTDSFDLTDTLSGTANTDNIFRWTGSPDYQYIYNLGTAGRSAGTYYVQLTLYAADGVTALAVSPQQYFVLRS